MRALPFTVKTDLRDHYPFGLFARPLSESCAAARVVRHDRQADGGRLHRKPISRTWADLMARSIACAGGAPGDVVHNAYGYGLFTGGLGAHYGAERLGAIVVPMSGGSTERQVALIVDFGARVLCATPSYALAIAEVAEQQGVDLPRSAARGRDCSAPSRGAQAMRREIEARLGLTAIDVYGLSEIMGPGVACECECQAGLHGWEDHFLFEVIDPETGRPMPEGEPGELVITTLTKEALPMLRYRTRDITRVTTAPCDCGRTHLRILRITGRNDDMLIIRGVNVYPSQIEAVLVGLPGHRAALPARRRAPRQPRPRERRGRGAARRRARCLRGARATASRTTSSRWSASPPTSWSRRPARFRVRRARRCACATCGRKATRA